MKILFPLLLAGVAHSMEIDPDQKFNNKVSANSRGWLRYERSLGAGFHVGSALRYVVVVEGDRLVHADQQPSYWLLAISHQYESSFIDLENRLLTLSNEFEWLSARYELQARKRFRFENRWAISPFLQLIEYVFDSGELDESRPNGRSTHHAEFKTNLGIDLELLF